jgi:hypothetical protein
LEFALRGRRPLRGVYTGFASGLPLVGEEVISYLLRGAAQ